MTTSSRSVASPERKVEWTEATVWAGFRSGWVRLFSGLRETGFSLEWHDFDLHRELDWSPSYHPDSVEICFNLRGRAWVEAGVERREFGDDTVGFYARNRSPLLARRIPGGRHQFLTLELSAAFLRRHLEIARGDLHRLVRELLEPNGGASGVSDIRPLSSRQQQIIGELRHPPVHEGARALWYQGKVLELISELLLVTPEGEFFCSRQQRLARERVQKVAEFLKRHMAEPPALEVIARHVGCSSYYLSRTFSKEMGITIPQYLRKLRMERAAALLKTGKFNVTEVALEVGYSSLSHFSQAFCQTMGCCPAIYPLRKPRE
jgi:AraC-like DNA-binding protein